MNLKRYLQQQAEKDAENLLTEEDKLFCMRLAEDVQEQPEIAIRQRPKSVIWAAVSSAVAVALVAVIVLPIMLTRSPVNVIEEPANDVYYNDEKIEHTVCSLEDMNSDLTDLMFIEQENNINIYEMYYDTVSDDHLYYDVKVTTVLSEFKLYIEVNENYNYKFDLSEELITEQLNQYAVNYLIVENDTMGRLGTAYRGYIKLNTEKVYIEYQQTIDLGDYSGQAFFDDIQSVLKAKN